MESTSVLIQQLRKFDHKDYYKKEFNEVAELAQPFIKELVEIGEPVVEDLGNLANEDNPYVENTFASYFALAALRKIKSEKVIPYLIEFLKKDLDDGNEEAMFALQEIGQPAIAPLVKAVEACFENKIYIFHLIGALTEIKDKQVYDFLIEKVNDFLNNLDYYSEWFCIDDFVYGFVEQENKEALSLLKKIKEKVEFSKHQLIEIDDTIKRLEDPESALKEDEDVLEKINKSFNLLTLVNANDEVIEINEETITIYEDFLSTIDEEIYELSKKNPKLSDFDFVEALKNLRDNLFSKNYELKNELEREIYWRIFRFLVDNRGEYSKNEVMTCLRKILNLIRDYRNEFGKRGYLDRLNDDFKRNDDSKKETRENN